MQVPPLFAKPSEAGWYEYSPTPGQVGPSVIVGHIDTYQGPSVFYRLGAMRPGEEVDVGLADGTTAVFRVTGVRAYSKASFPSRTVYGPTSNAALRLITCGGDFDPTTGPLPGQHRGLRVAGVQPRQLSRGAQEAGRLGARRRPASRVREASAPGRGEVADQAADLPVLPERPCSNGQAMSPCARAVTIKPSGTIEN